MSFLARGSKRGRRGAAFVVAGALMAFQALVVIGATPALALSSCTFSGGVLTVVLTAGESTTFSQNATGDILINGLTQSPTATA